MGKVWDLESGHAQNQRKLCPKTAQTMPKTPAHLAQQQSGSTPDSQVFRSSSPELPNPKFAEQFTLRSTRFYGTLPRFVRQKCLAKQQDMPLRLLKGRSGRFANCELKGETTLRGNSAGSSRFRASSSRSHVGKSRSPSQFVPFPDRHFPTRHLWPDRRTRVRPRRDWKGYSREPCTHFGPWRTETVGTERRNAPCRAATWRIKKLYPSPFYEPIFSWISSVRLWMIS